MNVKNYPYAILSKTALFALLVSSLSSSVNAKVDSVLTTNNDGKYVEYKLDDVKESYFDKITGGKGALFEKYSNEKICAYHDDKINKYVDYEAVKQNYFDALTSNHNFDLNSFTESVNDKKDLKDSPDEIIIRKTDDSGAVIDKVIVNLKIDTFDVLNGKLIITFNKSILDKPKVADFIVMQDDATLRLVDEDIKLVDGKVEITIPEVLKTDKDKKVKYVLTYKNKESKEKTLIIKGDKNLEYEKIGINLINELETSLKKDLTEEININQAEKLIKSANNAVAQIKDEAKKKELQQKINEANKIITDARAKFDENSKKTSLISNANNNLKSISTIIETTNSTEQNNWFEVNINKLKNAVELANKSINIAKRQGAKDSDFENLDVLNLANSIIDNYQNSKDKIEKAIKSIPKDITKDNYKNVEKELSNIEKIIEDCTKFVPRDEIKNISGYLNIEKAKKKIQNIKNNICAIVIDKDKGFKVIDSYDGSNDKISLNEGFISVKGATIKLYQWNDKNNDGKISDDEIGKTITLTSKSEADGSVQASDIGDLKAGEYMFIVTATDINGNESEKSINNVIKIKLVNSSKEDEKFENLVKVNEDVSLIIARNESGQIDIKVSSAKYNNADVTIKLLNKDGDIKYVNQGKLEDGELHFKASLDDGMYTGAYNTVGFKKIEIPSFNIEKVDKTALNNLIKETNEIKNIDNKYTEDSFKALKEAIKAAEAVANKKEVTKDEVREQVKALKEAKAGLKEAKQEEPSTPVENKDGEIVKASILKVKDFTLKEEPTIINVKEAVKALVDNAYVQVEVAKTSDGKFEVTLTKGEATEKKTINVEKEISQMDPKVIVEVFKESPAPGKKLVSIKLEGIDDPTEWNVSINGQKLDYEPEDKTFDGFIKGLENKEDVIKKIKIEKIKSSSPKIVVEVFKESPAPGKKLVSIKLEGIDDPTKWTVSINGQKLEYEPEDKTFDGFIKGLENREDVIKKVKVELAK